MSSTPGPSAYPSVGLAYEQSQAAYALAESRLAAVDRRLESLQALAMTVTFAVPVLVRTLEPVASFKTPWLIAALVCFILVMFGSTVVRAQGYLRVVSPAELYKNTLHLSEFDYKANSIYWAARHFEWNLAVISRKGVWANRFTVVVVAEFALLLGWAIREIGL